MTIQELVSLLPSTDRTLRSMGLSRTSQASIAAQSLGAFGIGLLVGAGVALLLAPMTGREFREKVQEQLQTRMNGNDTASAD